MLEVGGIEVPLKLAVAAGVGVVTLLLLLVVGLLRPKKKFLLGLGERQQLVLSAREALSEDVIKFTFKLPRSTPVLGLPCGKHIKFFAPSPALRKAKAKGQWNGREDSESGAKEIERKYTPVTSDTDVGRVEFVIKVYSGGVIERFPDGGKMSQFMGGLEVGDTVDISGPVGMHEYVGRGVFRHGKKALPAATRIGMMAGGTGITPMLQASFARTAPRQASALPTSGRNHRSSGDHRHSQGARRLLAHALPPLCQPN